MRLPSQISPLKPTISPSETKAKPSPLRRAAGLDTTISTPCLTGRTDFTVPISSPMDLGASRQAHESRLPSRYNSVNPRLKVLLKSGVKPPSTWPKDARPNLSPELAHNVFSSRLYSLTVFLTNEAFFNLPSILKEVTPAATKSASLAERFKSFKDSRALFLTRTFPDSSSRS